MVVSVHVGNQGADRLPADAGTLEVYGEIDGGLVRIASAPFSAPVPAGTFGDSVAIEIATDLDLAGFDALVVEFVAAIAECDSDNNRVRFEGPFCR